MTNTTVPKIVEVGLGVMIFNNGKMLVGKRIGSHSPGKKNPLGENLSSARTSLP